MAGPSPQRPRGRDKLDSEGSRPRWPAPHPNGPVGGTNSTLRAPTQDVRPLTPTAPREGQIRFRGLPPKMSGPSPQRPRGRDKLDPEGSRPRCPAPWRGQTRVCGLPPKMSGPSPSAHLVSGPSAPAASRANCGGSPAPRRRLLPDVAAPPQGPGSSPTPQPHPAPPARPSPRSSRATGSSPARPRPPGPTRHFRPPPDNGRPPLANGRPPPQTLNGPALKKLPLCCDISRA
ncbi:proline-rich protein HaeIII subfamily 1-like [Tachyglossus aculeatus]|uniref:proline-rich protein HaeIII subfamily 1-like n=1 Tax=Tachyglossus aculeatus TaxID=9261 RepID=UPI0018F473CB|nr:proline-rich protein HaeIII subfamily 1-like [Tachyglossus aculeatus]